MRFRFLIPILVALLAAVSCGCRHFGPRSIVADRIPYNEAIARSWKEQTLLNIVKLRYADTPFFVDVPQITSGYTLQGTATGGGSISSPVNPAASFAQQLGGSLLFQGAYQDRPTISYQPQTGSQFIRNITSPINPGSVLFLLQSGYPADLVFELTVDSINGIRNRNMTGGELKPADPEFTWLIQTLRKAQIAGNVGIRVSRDKDGKDSVAFFFQDQSIDPAMKEELAKVRQLLKIDPARGEFRVTFGAAAANPNEIAILSRSVFLVLGELATFVEAPAVHQASGIAIPFDGASDDKSPLRVFSGSKKPCDPFVCVFYEGHWFWIEKNDFRSKRTLAYLLVLLALSDTGAKENLPVITIQAN